jgi:hypothetical protein
MRANAARVLVTRSGETMGSDDEIPDPSQTFVSRGLAESLRKSREVLDEARATRRAIFGAEEEDPPLPVEPLARAAEVLRRAALVREEAMSGGRAVLEREAAARAELELLKRGLPPVPDEVSIDEPAPPPGLPRRREI